MDRYNKFTVLINRIVRNIHRIKHEAMSQFGLMSTHVSCLYYLYKEGKALTARELCDVCEEDKAAVSRAIDLLSREGYLTCGTAAAKKYKSPITLTEKGEETGKAIAEKIDDVLREVSNDVSEERREIFYDCLETISDNLQRICGGED
ncbi:MAG: MarR family transcriptional regulator [Clostridiales bacterium]|nr:MarR family transcriptional regulator [Clostridiales bacterium]